MVRLRVGRVLVGRHQVPRAAPSASARPRLGCKPLVNDRLHAAHGAHAVCGHHAAAAGLGGLPAETGPHLPRLPLVPPHRGAPAQPSCRAAVACPAFMPCCGRCCPAAQHAALLLCRPAGQHALLLCAPCALSPCCLRVCDGPSVWPRICDGPSISVGCVRVHVAVQECRCFARVSVQGCRCARLTMSLTTKGFDQKQATVGP